MTACKGSGSRVQIWAVSVLSQVSKRWCVCSVCGNTVKIVIERRAHLKPSQIVGSH